MAPERIAVTTILVCIGILLLSACGLPLGRMPRAQTSIVPGNFTLYAPDHSVLGTGYLSPGADLSHLTATVTLRSPACLHDATFQLTGALGPTLNLHTAQDSGLQLTLLSAQAPLYGSVTIRVLPFRGSLTLAHSCADGTLPVAAELMQKP